MLTKILDFFTGGVGGKITAIIGVASGLYAFHLQVVDNARMIAYEKASNEFNAKVNEENAKALANHLIELEEQAEKFSKDFKIHQLETEKYYADLLAKKDQQIKDQQQIEAQNAEIIERAKQLTGVLDDDAFFLLISTRNQIKPPNRHNLTDN